jgi:hypothetical protein
MGGKIRIAWTSRDNNPLVHLTHVHNAFFMVPEKDHVHLLHFLGLLKLKK